MKFDSVGKINPGETPGNLGAVSGDDFLARVNATVSNIRQLLLTVMEVRGMKTDAGGNQSQAIKTNLADQGNRPAALRSAIEGMLDNLINKGYGAITVQQIIQQYGGLSIKQIREILRNA